MVPRLHEAVERMVFLGEDAAVNQRHTVYLSEKGLIRQDRCARFNGVAQLIGKAMKQASISDLEYNEVEGLYYLNGELFSGLAYSTRDGNFRDAEVSYVGGARSGRTREWYRPERLMLDEMYLDGGLHGYARRWYENGQLKKEGEYEHGVALWEKSWDEHGNLLKEFVLSEDSPNYRLLLKFREIRQSRTDSSGNSVSTKQDDLPPTHS